MMNSLLLSITLLAIACFHPTARAADPDDSAERMRWFNEARFGMFIHWGLYSEAAGEWNGKPIDNIGEWIQSNGKIPAAEYRETLLGKFNPVAYDPEAWVIAAKNAGMKYLVITSKHHDGFCLWDSSLTDWDIGSTPYQKDLLRPLKEACDRHGVRFCVYHSIMDWSHPDWGTKAPWRGNAGNPKPDMDRFSAYLKGQLSELIENYQPGIIWFDGEWEDAWTHERGKELYAWLRQKDPKLIINNRVDKGRAGMQGHTKDPKYMGDYGTPEQEIPSMGFGANVSWESCMTMNQTWGFKRNDHDWKSDQVLIQNLIDIASKGGNYLLNVGPTGAGEIPQPSLDALAKIGAWMKTNAESIHGTSASLFPKISWNGRSTTRSTPQGTRLYLHVFGKPSDDGIEIDGLQSKPERTWVLGAESAPLDLEGAAGKWRLKIPAPSIHPIATVIALEFKETPVIRIP
jgi:alpha-L-fucosidase